MPPAPSRHDSRNEIWFLTSEIEGQRAGGFRQGRWCEICLRLGARIRIFNVPDAGAFRLSEMEFQSSAEFLIFREKAMTNSAPRAAIRQGRFVPLLRRAKHLILVDLYYPNILRLASRLYFRVARSAEPVVIFCSSPPFSLALVGAFLKTAFPEKVILAVDMRDPWTYHKSLTGIRPLKLWLEGKVLRKADRLSTVSYGLRDEFEENHGVKMQVFYNIASHYADNAETGAVNWSSLNPAIAHDRLKVIYTGSTPETYYDLVSLAKGMAGLRERNPRAADRMQFIFVGACGELQRELSGHRIGNGDVIFIPHVSQQMARSIQQQADVLLFLTYLGRGAVSTKIFEYMALGKPILPISVVRGSDADQLFSKYCGTCLYLHNSTEIEQALEIAAGDSAQSALPRLRDPSILLPLLEAYDGFARQLVFGR